jgi:gamma-glutamyltranspeptidase/glutathione hydrolase
MMGPAVSVVSHRNTARGKRGVVSAASSEAAIAGRDALARGGNAFDAALAAAFMETVILPSKCGLAGDVVAIVQVRGERPKALIAIGTAAAGLEAAVRDRGMPKTGGLSVGVPGAPAGYAAIAELATLGLAKLAAPAILASREGFAWSPLTERYIEQAEGLLQQENPNGTTYLPETGLHAAGDWVTLPGLGALLEEFVALGSGLFHGALGEKIVEAVAERGGILTMDDLRGQSAEWAELVGADVADHRISATPNPTHGPSLVQAVVGSEGSSHPDDLIPAVLEAARVRRREAGDITGDGGTSVITAADHHGNVIVLVHSVSHPTFGSGIVVPDYDFVLSNRAGRGFTSIPGHPNAPAPGKRPMTTLHAWMLERDGERYFGATSGGEQQMPWSAQVVSRLICGEPQASAVMSPLWGVDPVTEALKAEADARQPWGTPALSLRSSTRVPEWGMASGIQVLRVRDGEPMTVVSDIRSVGGAVGL